MKKRNITIVAYPLVPGKIGGVETYFKGILKELIKQFPPSYNVHLILGRAANIYVDYWEEMGGVVQNCIVSKSFSMIKSLRDRSLALSKAIIFPKALRLEILTTQPSLVFFPLTVSVPFFHREFREFPVVTTVHDVLHLVQRKMFKSMAEKIYRAITYRPTIVESDGLIVPSKYTQATIKECYNLNENKIKVIPYGVDLTIFSDISTEQEDRILDKYQLLRRRYVIYPANTWFHKNHHGLISTWKEIADRLPEDIWLVFCGQIFQALPDADDLYLYRIEHIGYVEQMELSVLYRRAHAMIFPSLFEGFGAPPLEAMACGTVTMSSNKASLAEVLPKDYSLQFDPNNYEEMASVILAGCIDKKIRKTAVSDGLAHSREFSWENAGRQHVNFMLEHINKNKR